MIRFICKAKMLDNVEILIYNFAMLEKNLRISLLNDFYGNLLTDVQEKFIIDYYNNNISLGEIAEKENISRQAVRDAISKAVKKLEEFENKLGLLNKFEKQKEIINLVKEKNNILLVDNILKVWED